MLKEDKIVLTPKQNECVNYPMEKNILVRGIAGSGKSLVIIRRAKRILDQMDSCGQDVRIVIYTYANSLVYFMKEVMALGGKYADAITITTLDKEILSVYRTVFNCPRLYGVYPNPGQCNDILDSVISDVIDEENEDNRFLQDSLRKFLENELAWMKQHMFTKSSQYINCVRKGRGSIRISKQDRSLIFDIYTAYYKELEKKYPFNFDTLCEKLYSHRSEIPDSCKYDFVLIDEAQDLPLNKMLIARELTEGALTISADFAQKIYNSGFTWKEVGISFRGQAAKKLNGTHRNTLQIAKFANNIARHNTELSQMDEDDGYSAPELPEREGALPILRYTSTIDSEGREIAALVRRIRKESPDMTIGILGRTARGMNIIKRWLTGFDYEVIEIPRNSEPEFRVLEPGVKLVTYHSSKGLEFDVVILPMLDDGVFPFTYNVDTSDKEILEDAMNSARSLLYVGVTRARSELYMFAGDGTLRTPSPVIAEIDKTLYEVVSK